MLQLMHVKQGLSQEKMMENKITKEIFYMIIIALGMGAACILSIWMRISERPAAPSILITTIMGIASVLAIIGLWLDFKKKKNS
jgi:uncharacterized membrane protein HdeD (DUF308 family)